MIRSPSSGADLIKDQGAPKLSAELKKIRIFADNNLLLCLRYSGKSRYLRLNQTDIKNMLTIEAAIPQVQSRGRW
jgi:hypothetical protein